MMLKLNVKTSVFHEQIYLIRNQVKEVAKERVPKNAVASPSVVATKVGEFSLVYPFF